MQLQPFELAHAALGAEVDPFGAGQFGEQVREQVAPLGQSEGGELHH